MYILLQEVRSIKFEEVVQQTAGLAQQLLALKQGADQRQVMHSCLLDSALPRSLLHECSLERQVIDLKRQVIDLTFSSAPSCMIAVYSSSSFG